MTLWLSYIEINFYIQNTCIIKILGSHLHGNLPEVVNEGPHHKELLSVKFLPLTSRSIRLHSKNIQ